MASMCEQILAKFSYPQKAGSTWLAADEAIPQLFKDSQLLDVGMNHILDVQVLGDYSNLAVMRAIVGTSKQSLIYKAWPAERAESSLEQLQAEQKAGVLFRSNPTLIPPVAISGNTPSGSFTTVSTFGGCSLKDMMDSNKWWKLPPHDRAVMYKRVGACSFTALETMNEAGSCHRDVKPDNIVLNKDTGVAGLIDFGCMMRLDGSDYHRGFTLSYLPPELAVPEILQDDEACRAVTSCKMDTYNMGFLGMHMIFDLPQQVDITEYNPDDEASLASYLGHIRTFDWSPQLEWLRDNGLGDLADLLAAFLAKDPALRPTAAEALQMRFLADVADEVGEAIARATPGFVVEQQAAVAMLEGLRGQPCTFVAEQLYSNTCSYSACYSSSYDCNSSNSSYCGSAATACCSDEQAAALLAAKSVLQSMACSSNCTTSSSIVPDTPCVNSARHSCSSSIAEENSMASNSSSSTCNIVQQPPAAEPMAAAVYVIEQQHQQPQSIVETPQAVQPPAAAVCESGQQKQQKSGVLQRAAEFMMCMVWEVTFSG